MNKFLLASTALVASATIASAEVTLTGSAEMGVFGVDADLFSDVDNTDLEFHTDIDVTFTMTGETDSGVSFGASIDLDESDGSGNCALDDNLATTGVTSINGTVIGAGATCSVQGFSNAFSADDRQGGETIFVDSAFGRLTMGDTDGAFDLVLQEASIGGSLQDNEENIGWSGNSGLDGLYDGQIATYSYAFGDFTVAASAEVMTDNDPVLGLGARYAGEFGGFSFGAGLGYQHVGDDNDAGREFDVFGVSLDVASGNGIEAVLNYSDLDGLAGADSNYGIAVGYSFGAFLVAANYNQFDLVGGGDSRGYSLIANYDLGGEAELQFGYGHNEPGGANNDFDTYSFGIAMGF